MGAESPVSEDRLRLEDRLRELPEDRLRDGIRPAAGSEVSPSSGVLDLLDLDRFRFFGIFIGLQENAA